MTEEAQKIADKMKEMFPNNLVDPEVFPRIFQYQVKLAKFQIQLERNKQ